MFDQNNNTDDQTQAAGGPVIQPAADTTYGDSQAAAPPTSFNPSEFAANNLPVAPAADPVSAPEPVSDSGSNDLVSIKQAALQQLSPLVSHLEQSPEEKFRTTMMMIQASDDQSLIQTAYEAAQAISDEKARAQALLDVVNEINYFTQNAQNQQ